MEKNCSNCLHSQLGCSNREYDIICCHWESLYCPRAIENGKGYCLDCKEKYTEMGFDSCAWIESH